MISIKRCTTDDVTKVSFLWEKMSRELWPHANPNPTMWSREAIKLLLSKEYWISVVVNEEGSYIGFIDGLVIDDALEGGKIGICRYLYVIPKYRHSNAAHLLVADMENIAQTKRITTLNIMCAPEREKLWKSKGFETYSLVMRRSN